VQDPHLFALLVSLNLTVSGATEDEIARAIAPDLVGQLQVTRRPHERF
jgi:hypothetical protein